MCLTATDYSVSRNGSSDAPALGGHGVPVGAVSAGLAAVGRRPDGRRDAVGLRTERVQLIVVEHMDATADGERVVAVVDVVTDAAAREEAFVDEHRAHVTLIDVDDDALVRHAHRRPAAAHQHVRLHRRRHLPTDGRSGLVVARG